MLKVIIFFLILLIPSVAYAKNEEETKDAQSVVLYGYDGTTLRAWQVLADGTLVLA